MSARLIPFVDNQPGILLGDYPSVILLNDYSGRHSNNNHPIDSRSVDAHEGHNLQFPVLEGAERQRPAPPRVRFDNQHLRVVAE